MKLVIKLAAAALLAASALTPALAGEYAEGKTLEERNTYLYTPDATLRAQRRQAASQPRAQMAADAFAQAPADVAIDRHTSNVANY